MKKRTYILTFYPVIGPYVWQHSATYVPLLFLCRHNVNNTCQSECLKNVQEGRQPATYRVNVFEIEGCSVSVTLSSNEALVWPRFLQSLNLQRSLCLAAAGICYTLIKRI